MTTVVFSLESVLTSGSNESILANESFGQGRILFDALKSQYRVIVLSSYPDAESVKGWLLRERCSGFSFVYGYNVASGLSPEDWKVDKIRELVSIGHHISFFVDGNPDTVRKVMELGVDALLVAYTGKLPGSFGRDREIVPWYDLVQTVEQHAVLKAAKAAGEDDE